MRGGRTAGVGVAVQSGIARTQSAPLVGPAGAVLRNNAQAAEGGAHLRLTQDSEPASSMLTLPQLPPPRSPVSDRAALLARKYRLEFSEAKRLVQEFDTFKKLGGEEAAEAPTLADFRALVCRVYEMESTRHISDFDMQGGYNEVCVEGKMSDKSFFDWYIAHLFRYRRPTEGIRLEDEADEQEEEEDEMLLPKSESALEAVARLKNIFYDVAEGSNVVDFSGFKKIYCALVLAKSTRDVCDTRIKSVWQGLACQSPSGKLTLGDLVTWYVGCMDSTALQHKPDLAVAESFYLGLSCTRRLAYNRSSSLGRIGGA